MPPPCLRVLASTSGPSPSSNTTDLRKCFASALQACFASREILPAQNCDIAIGRRYLKGATNPACHLSSNDRSAGTAKRLIDRIAGCGIVLNRPLHALNGLLRRMSGFGFMRLVYLPESRLLAVAGPMPGLALADGIPAGLVLEVIVAPADGELLLGPDDLGADLEARSNEASETMLLGTAGLRANNRQPRRGIEPRPLASRIGRHS